MRIIHGRGYSLEEKKQYVGLIFQNINAAVKMLIRAMEKLGKFRVCLLICDALVWLGKHQFKTFS